MPTQILYELKCCWSSKNAKSPNMILRGRSGRESEGESESGSCDFNGNRLWRYVLTRSSIERQDLRRKEDYRRNHFKTKLCLQCSWVQHRNQRKESTLRYHASSTNGTWPGRSSTETRAKDSHSMLFSLYFSTHHSFSTFGYATTTAKTIALQSTNTSTARSSHTLTT